MIVEAERDDGALLVTDGEAAAILLDGQVWLTTRGAALARGAWQAVKDADLPDDTPDDLEQRLAALAAELASDEPPDVAASQPDRPSGGDVPNPAPKEVAAGVSVEDIRNAWYRNAAQDGWISEIHLDPLQLIVTNDRDRSLSRVPVTVTDGQVTFGTPTAVRVEYVDQVADRQVAASRLVYASRAESGADESGPDGLLLDDLLIPEADQDYGGDIPDGVAVAAGIYGDVVEAHLPGRHNQGAHANRYKTPGNKSSGLREKTDRARNPTTHKEVHDPAPAMTPEGGAKVRKLVEEQFPPGTKVKAREWITAMEKGDYRGATSASYELMQQLGRKDHADPAVQRAKKHVVEIHERFSDLRGAHSRASLLRSGVPQLKDITSAEVRALGLTGRETKKDLPAIVQKLKELRRQSKIGRRRKVSAADPTGSDLGVDELFAQLDPPDSGIAPDEEDQTSPDSGGVPVTPAAEPEHIRSEEDSMSMSEVRSRLGLTPDVTDEALLAALDDVLDKATAPTPEPVAAAALPPGVVTIEASMLDELRRGATAGVQAAERQRTEDRDRFISAAVTAGKFAPARVEHWTKAWNADPDGTKATIDGLAEGLIPVAAAGYTGTPESSAEEFNDAEAAAWGAAFGLPKEALRG